MASYALNDFFETMHNIPSLLEQEKIAGFFNELDKKIEQEKEKLDALNRWKKGLMQQMFV